MGKARDSASTSMSRGLGQASPCSFYINVAHLCKLGTQARWPLEIPWSRSCHMDLWSGQCEKEDCSRVQRSAKAGDRGSPNAVVDILVALIVVVGRF